MARARIIWPLTSRAAISPAIRLASSRSAGRAGWPPFCSWASSSTNRASRRGVGRIGLEIVLQDGDGGGAFIALQVDLGQRVKGLHEAGDGLGGCLEPRDRPLAAASRFRAASFPFRPGRGLEEDGVGPVLLDLEHHVCLAERFVGVAQLELGLPRRIAQVELARAALEGFAVGLGQVSQLALGRVHPGSQERTHRRSLGSLVDLSRQLDGPPEIAAAGGQIALGLKKDQAVGEAGPVLVDHRRGLVVELRAGGRVDCARRLRSPRARRPGSRPRPGWCRRATP